jgi:hypothetical protein
MADLKISALTAATTPLAGTEVLPIVQGGVTTKVAVSDLTAGRAVTASSVNKVAITAPATASTLTIADGKTLAVNDNATLGTGGLTLGNSGGFTAAASKVLTANNTLTLAGTDGSSLAIGVGGTAVTTATLNNATLAAAFTAGTVTDGSFRVQNSYTPSNQNVTFSVEAFTGSVPTNSKVSYTSYNTTGTILVGSVVYWGGVGSNAKLLLSASTDMVNNGTSTPTGWQLDIDRAGVITTSASLVVGTSFAAGTTVKAGTGGFVSSDNTAGISGTMTTAALVGKTLTFKDGIIVGFA